MLAALVAFWGSAFMFVKVGVSAVPPATLVAARLTIGAVILLAVIRALGYTLPPLGRAWTPYVVLAVVGNCLPYWFISWGQQYIDSALAGILMAAMPLVTLVLAHLFVQGERMTHNRAAGFALGFLGIVLLIGPAAFSGIGGSTLQVISQLAVLAGALCYATSSVLTRLMIKGNVLIASAAMLLVASVVMLPLALIIDRPWTLAPSFASTAAIVWLGIGPTAIATLCYFKLIKSAGPSFMSLVHYLSPPVAVFLGVTLMGEHPGVEAYTGLALILAGIALSQLRRRMPSAP